MGLRCSLLGHEYGESTVERDREERGNEVVITEREVQECERCGSEKVISENTEVRSLEPEPETEPEPTSGPEATTEPAASSEPGAEPGSSSVGSFVDEAESGVTDEFEPPASPETDDAVILDEDDEESTEEDRQRGQWPETDDHRQSEGEESSREPSEQAEQVDRAAESAGAAEPAEPTESESGAASAADEAEVLDADAEAGRDTAAEEAATAWPDHEGEDRGYAAEPDDSEFQFGSESISSDDIEAAADESGGEAVEPAEATEDTEYVESGSGITSAGPFEESDTDTIDTVLVCPECGLEREAAGSSLRAGDICPECKRGYLAER